MKTFLISLMLTLLSVPTFAQDVQAKRDLKLNMTKAVDFKLEPKPGLEFCDTEVDTNLNLDFKPTATLISDSIYNDFESKMAVFACIFILQDSEDYKKKND